MLSQPAVNTLRHLDEVMGTTARSVFTQHHTQELTMLKDALITAEPDEVPRLQALAAYHRAVLSLFTTAGA